MVAFFQYLAEQKCGDNDEFIFAIEEPENCLHPRLQRELINSFRQLADTGCQIIVTSHSPVFVGASPIEDLALIVRESDIAKGIQYPDLNLEEVSEELVSLFQQKFPIEKLSSLSLHEYVVGQRSKDFFCS